MIIGGYLYYLTQIISLVLKSLVDLYLIKKSVKGSHLEKSDVME